MNADREDALRARIGNLLAEGLKTQTEPVPQNNSAFSELLAALRELDPEDLEGKLILSGFDNEPHGEDRMRCQECMYYLVHRKRCDLPELAVAVEPDWCCRLWRP